MTTGHENENITVAGAKAMMQKYHTDKMKAAVDTEKDRAMAAEALLQSLYQGLTNNEVQVVQSLPSTGTDGVIYRLIGQNSYSDNMYKNGAWITLATYEGQPIMFVHLTQAEYDALTEFEKNNGTYYFVEEE